MKLCITSKGPELKAEVDPRFGRAAYFIIVDSETGDFHAKQNEAVNAPGGAGIQAGQTVTEEGVQAVITGNVGPNAFDVLEKAGISVIVDVEGTVDQALKDFQAGKLENNATDGPTVKGK